MATAAKAHTKTIEREAPANNLLDEAIANTERRKGVVSSAAAVLGVNPAQLCGLLRNVWKVSNGQPPLTDQEMFTGISMIARFELDPIAREVYVTRTKQGLATIVGIDGWVKILDRTDHYDGYEMEIHEDEKGNIDYVDCTIHSTKRKYPSKYRAIAKEYARLAGFMAEKIPSHMLRIFALRHAARLFTPLGGNVMTEEEALYMQSFAPTTNAKTASLNELAESKMVDPPAEYRDPSEITPEEEAAILEAEKGDAHEG